MGKKPCFHGIILCCCSTFPVRNSALQRCSLPQRSQGGRHLEVFPDVLKSSVLGKHFCVEKPSLNQPVCHEQLNPFAKFFKLEFSSAGPVRSKSNAAGCWSGREWQGPNWLPCPSSHYNRKMPEWETPFPCSGQEQLTVPPPWPTGTNPASHWRGSLCC